MRLKIANKIYRAHIDRPGPGDKMHLYMYPSALHFANTKLADTTINKLYQKWPCG